MVTCDGVLVNWRHVQDGLAWCFMKYLTQPKACLPLEREARDARREISRCRRASGGGLFFVGKLYRPSSHWCPTRQQLLDFSLVGPVGANLASLNLASLRMNQTWGAP